jgi:Ca2+-binding RTX toxin-like protein
MTVNAGDHQALVAGPAGDSLTVTGGTHAFLYGPAGNDTFTAAGGSDAALLGGTGNGTFTVSGGTRAYAYGGPGNDTLTATGGDQAHLFGMAGDDVLAATGGTGVVLNGGSGNDQLTADDPAPVQVWGGRGNDTLVSAAIANDTLAGEEGDDWYRTARPAAPVTLTLDEALKYGATDPTVDLPRFDNDVLDFSAQPHINFDLAGVSDSTAAVHQAAAPDLNVVLYGRFADVIGPDGNDTLKGNALDNVLIGGTGDDCLVAGSGNDTLVGGDGNNTLVGGGGNDTFLMRATSPGTDVVFGGAANTLDVLDFSAQPAGVSIDLRTAAAQQYGARTVQIVGTVAGAVGTPYNDSLTGADASSYLSGGGGNDTLIGIAGDDTLVSGAGASLLVGGSGNNRFEENPGTFDTIVHGGGKDTIDFSNARTGVSVNLGLAAGQVQTIDAAGDKLVIEGQLSEVIGSPFDDTIVGNTSDNVLIGGGGRDYIDGSGGNNLIRAGTTQVVLLDFDTATTPAGYPYSPAERDAIQARLQAIYAAFPVEFTRSAATAAADSAFEGGQYTTIFFNKGSAGGSSSQIDFGNVDLAGTSTVDALDLLSPDPTSPLYIPTAIVPVSATIAAHELGHQFGLRHGETFGPIGSGIYLPADGRFGPSNYTPTYTGPTAATETPDHVMGSPASVDVTVQDAAATPYFGEREAIKLAFDWSGTSIPEPAGPHDTFATAVRLGDDTGLPGLTVPNTLKPGEAHYGTNGVPNTFAVGAESVLGDLVIPGDRDLYAFTGLAGQVFTFDLLSENIKRFGPDVFDGVLQLLDSSGHVLATADNDFESGDPTLLDVPLPADGMYYVAVSANQSATGKYYLYGYTFSVGPDRGIGDTLISSGGQDTLVGGDAPDHFVITLAGAGATVIAGSPLNTVDASLSPNFDPANVSGTSNVKLSPDHLPVFADKSETVTAFQGTQTQFTFPATDADAGDVLTYTLSGPAGATIDPGTGTVTWAPPNTGTFGMTVTATDKVGGYAKLPVTVNVSNAGVSGVQLTPSPGTINEGDQITLSGVFVDPGAMETHTVVIDWGDQSADTTVNLGVGVLSFDGVTHQYSDNRPGNVPYSIQATVTNSDNKSAGGTAPVTVLNVVPTVALPAVSDILAGQPVVATGSFTDPAGAADNAYTYRWTISHGGATVYDSGGLPTSYAAGVPGLSQPLAAAGQFTVVLVVTDKDGATGTQSRTVNVSPVVVGITRLDASPTNASAVHFLVSFSDPVSGLSASNFTVPTTGVTGAGVTGVSSNGDGHTWTVTAATGTGDGTVGLTLANTAGLTGPDSVAVAAQTTSAPVYTIDKTAPAVAHFYVLFGNGMRYDLATATRLNLPWAISAIQVQFSEAVAAAAASLTLSGRNGPLAVSNFTGSGTNTLTWILGTAVTLDQVSATLGTAAVHDLAGNAVTSPNTAFGFGVILGDVNGDRHVTTADRILMLNMIASHGYNVFYDLNGDGVVDNSDANILVSRLGTYLP